MCCWRRRRSAPHLASEVRFSRTNEGRHRGPWEAMLYQLPKSFNLVEANEMARNLDRDMPVTVCSDNGHCLTAPTECDGVDANWS